MGAGLPAGTALAATLFSSQVLAILYFYQTPDLQIGEIRTKEQILTTISPSSQAFVQFAIINNPFD